MLIALYHESAGKLGFLCLVDDFPSATLQIALSTAAWRGVEAAFVGCSGQHAHASRFISSEGRQMCRERLQGSQLCLAKKRCVVSR